MLMLSLYSTVLYILTIINAKVDQLVLLMAYQRGMLTILRLVGDHVIDYVVIGGFDKKRCK